MKTLYVFDKNGTLYDDAEAHRQFMEIVRRYASRLLVVPQEDVMQKIKLLQIKHKIESPLHVLMKEFSISQEDMVNNTYLQMRIDDCGIVSPDLIRHRALCKIIGPKVVFTNNSSVFARKILSYTGLVELFIDFIGMEELGFFRKPSVRSFEVVEKRHPGFNRIVLVDNLLKNLDVAYQLGWKTVWCKPVDASMETECKHLVISSFEELPSVLQ